MKKLLKETGVDVVGVDIEHVVDKHREGDEQNAIVELVFWTFQLLRGSMVVIFGLGFRRPVSSRYCFRRISSSDSFTKQNFAVCIICSNRAEFPFSLDRQSEGFSS